MVTVQRLELVEKAERLFIGIDLSKTLLIACQHILPTNYNMFLYLFNNGLKPENTYLLGKCYSTDNSAMQAFIEKGVKVHRSSCFFDSHAPFDEAYAKNAHNLVSGIINKVSLKKYQKVIILDDGGYLIEAVNKILYRHPNVIGIEQTSSGYDKIKCLNLKFPVINVARSFAKLKYESPFIAEQFVYNLDYELKQIGKRPKNILILGNGAIGGEIAKRLKNKFNIKIYDELSHKSDFRSFEDLKEQIELFDLVIGCTGKNSLPLSFYCSLKSGTVLVSASSSDREFEAYSLRRLEEKYNHCHFNLKIRDILLLNSGFPLTFTKHCLGLENKKIQLTRALIFSATCLALIKRYKKGIVELDSKTQDALIKGNEKIVS